MSARPRRVRDPPPRHQDAPKYLLDNAGAADIELSAADLAELDALPVTQGGRSY
ncbi:hypothetical protein ACFWPQ_22040 [Streptomyces sp. NPDC058464]|uniref:hypothetical protein n=1 Tax=Streptomyces sp. NPDC058464 TaxID=3346511 RepID=UPI00366A0F27